MSLQAVFIISGITLLTSMLGVLGVWFPPVTGVLLIVLVVSVLFLCLSLTKDVFSRSIYSPFHVIVLCLFVLSLGLLGVGVLLPETGFDALWYHLPLVKEYTEKHSLVYDPAFYQSLYPQYGDGLFVLGYSLWQVAGAKFVAYLFFLLLAVTCYFWLRRAMSVTDALLGVLVVCFFQVVTWQATSGYVDVISAVFFLWSMWWFFESDDGKESKKAKLIFWVSSLSAGIFFGTKFVNLGFLPLFAVLASLQLRVRNIRSVLKYVVVMVLVAFPWYFRAWLYTGSLIYPIGTVYAVPVITQMGVNGWSEWLTQRVRDVWSLPWQFFVQNDGYVTPLLLLFSPIVLFRKKMTRHAWLGVIVGGYGLLFWFFFPPPSTRYVLGSVILLWLVLFQQVVLAVQRSKLLYLIRLICIINILVFFSLRLFVQSRAVSYLMGWESQQEYLDRFRNGFTDEKINSFYGKSDFVQSE
jgi:hypothetical protein